MIVSILEWLVQKDILWLSDVSNYYLDRRLGTSILTAIFTLYGSYFLINIWSIHGYLSSFSTMHKKEIRKKAKDTNIKKFEITSFWKKHSSLAWLFLKNESLYRFSILKPKFSKLINVYNFITTIILLVDSFFFIISIAFPVMRNLAIDVAFIYTHFIVVPTALFYAVLKCFPSKSTTAENKN